MPTAMSDSPLPLHQTMVLDRYIDLYNIFCLVEDFIFKLKRKVGKGERNDKMTRKSKSKAHYINEKFNVVIF